MAGASHLLPGLHGMSEILRSKDEAEIIRKKKLRASDTSAAADHAFGTTRMSRRAEDGVVDDDGRCHETENIYVTDTSIFSGSPAVNPMLTCMALSDKIARGIAARW